MSRATSTEEEAGTELARKCELLSTLAKTHGIAVLVDHHHRKSGGKVEDLSRGGTALAGASENNVEIVRRGDWESRVRRLYSAGRHSATRWEREVELSDDGSDYTVPDAEPFKVQVLRQRAQWTAKEFAEEIERSVDVARRWLNESPHVERVKQAGVSGNAALYRVRDEPLVEVEVTDDELPEATAPRVF